MAAMYGGELCPKGIKMFQEMYDSHALDDSLI